MPVLYKSRDGNEYKIIPAPFCTVSKEYIRKNSSKSISASTEKANGPIIGSTFSITLTGTLTSHMGSPLVGVTGEDDRTFYSDNGYPSNSDTSSGGDGTGSWDFGSPPNPGTDESDNEHFKSILQKQLALRELFSNDGGKMTISTPTYKPFVCYPRVTSIDFEDSGVGDRGWNRTVDYTIQLETDRITGLPGPDGKIDEDWDKDDFKVTVGSTEYDRVYLDDVSEDWSIEFNESPSKPSDDGDDTTIGDMWTFRITHNVSATGKTAYEDSGLVREAWENAKIWTTSRLKGPTGYDTSVASNYDATDTSVVGIDSYSAYDHVRTESVDEIGGSHSITESWLLSKNPYLEDFTVSTRYDAESGVTTASIDGSVAGLETRDSDKMDDEYDIDNTTDITASKYNNAKTRFDQLTATSNLIIKNRVANILETTVSSLELVSMGSTRNKGAGTISYNFEFNDEKDDCEIFTACDSAVQDKIKKSSVQVNFTQAADVFAAITVLGRGGSSASNYKGTGTPIGPVLQDMGTTSLQKVSASVEVTMECDASSIFIATGDTLLVAQCVQSWILANVKPDTSTYKVFIESDTENWAPKTGKYSRNVTFAYGYCP